ncbi:precorrin-6A reductase [Synechococcus sp. WH 8020]|uniref:precorrin-6A reductase n=1 Tax=Synechococcus sp. (strain WH8020) TaxID=32052 RepID=UPI0006527EC1|nr:precorrin-6A reductase [Synechococcus sp. WH 8020]AKN62260.1 precorrin-6A reductase [Synechococcus sp. WH 8020]
MHRQTNRQGTVWLLAGTGDGPPLAAALISQGWRVHVSVVSDMAAHPYRGMAVEAIHVGALGGSQAISQWLQRIPVDWVVDATHPFALRISTQLHQSCQGSGQQLVRFERLREASGKAVVLGSIADLANQPLAGQRLLLALGARQLVEAAKVARQAGAIVFARVLPSPMSLVQAAAAGVSQEQLAVVRPLQGSEPGALEAALCRRWGITDVLCRQSGGATESLWENLSMEMGLGLWLLRRPVPMADVPVVHSLDQLLVHLNGTTP